MTEPSAPGADKPRSEEHFAGRALFERMAESPMSFWYWPDCSKPGFLSLGKTLRRLGYAEEEIPHEFGRYMDLVHGQDKPRLTRMVEDILQGTLTGDYEMEFRLRRKDGSYSWARVSASVEPHDRSRAPSVFGVTRILAPSEELHTPALRSSEDALHTVLNEIGYPVVLMALNGEVLQQNAAATRTISRDLPLHNGSRLYCPFLHETDGARVILDFIESVASSGQRRERELWRFGRWWHVHLVPLRNHQGEVTRLLLLAQDISTLKAEQEAQLAREKALTKTLVREVHHRIKNHLQGLVGLLRLQPATSRTVGGVIDNAVAQIQSIATVHGLQAQAGGAATEFSLLVTKIVEALQVGLPIPVTCIVEPPHAPPWSVPQEEAVPLAIAIGELFTNAVKHTRNVPGACVQGRLFGADGNIELRITNAPAQLPEGFSLADPLRRGTGLDLVRALLPRERAELQMAQEGDIVTTRLRLRPKD